MVDLGPNKILNYSKTHVKPMSTCDEMAEINNDKTGFIYINVAMRFTG